MIRFCTVISASDVVAGHALIRSLQRHAKEFHLHVLATDNEVSTSLAAIPQLERSVSFLELSQIISSDDNLKGLSEELSERAFSKHLRPWLVQHLLRQIPPGELLTLISPTVFFYSHPGTITQDIGEASIVLIRSADTNALYDRSWASFRNDPVGLACSHSWVKRSLMRDNLFSNEHNRSTYLESSFPHIQQLHLVVRSGIYTPLDLSLLNKHIGAGPTINGESVIAFNFHGLRKLADGIYDPGPVLRHASPDSPLKQLICGPYLIELPLSSHGNYPPEFVPLNTPTDPRANSVLQSLIDQAVADHDACDNLKTALSQARQEIGRLVQENNSRAAESERYIHQIEQDRNQQRQSFFDTRKRLEEVHDDLLHNIAYLKKLESNAAAQMRAAQEREDYIASLKQQLAERQSGKGISIDLRRLHEALIPYASITQRLLVAKYNAALMPLLLSLGAQGVTIEILGSPETLVGQSHHGLHFLGSNLWDWLGGLDSYFDEKAYCDANPDVAIAIANGTVFGAWDHYLRFGQFENRNTGSHSFRSGLSDFDAVAFDSADAVEIVPCIIGRLQPHHQLFISSSFNPATVWLPSDTPRTIIIDDLLCCPHPSPAWLGPPAPSALGRPYRINNDIAPFPEAPTQPAVWPKITVIVTGKNQAPQLKATLQSIVAQRYPMLECLVVDGQSDDESFQYLETLSEQLAWWTSEPFSTPKESIEIALRKATGDLVACLQPGDFLAPGSLFNIAQQFLLHAPDAIGGRCRVLSSSINRNQRSVLSLGRLQPLPLTELHNVKDFWLEDAFFKAPAFFVTLNALHQVADKTTDASSGHYYNLALKLARNGCKVLPLPEILAAQSADNRATVAI